MNQHHFLSTPYNTPFIPQRADPYILNEGGMYYFTASVPEYDRIVLRRSHTLGGLRTAQEKVLWRCHDEGIMSRHIWAPEIHRIGGQWVIYFAAGETPDKWKIRPWALVCSGEDPMEDPWQEAGQLTPADEFSFQDFSLDMTTFESGGERFCVWAEKVGAGRKISNLYIARQSSALALSSAQLLLTTPDYDWERVGFWVCEGPAFMRRDGKIFIAYSASSTGAAYCVGLLWAQEGANLMDPASWHKASLPVLSSDEGKGLFGPGHNSFFPDDEGSLCMAYHARQYDEIIGDSLYDPNRHCYVMKLAWQDGMPVFDFANQLFQP